LARPGSGAVRAAGASRTSLGRRGSTVSHSHRRRSSGSPLECGER
jgi:hypothetical protein